MATAPQPPDFSPWTQDLSDPSVWARISGANRISQAWNYNNSSIYGAMRGKAAPGAKAAPRPKGRQVWNYDVAPLSAGYGRAWEQLGEQVTKASLVAKADADALKATQTKQSNAEAALVAEQVRALREAKDRERALEDVSRQSAYDALQEQFMQLGLDGGQVMAALKGLGRDGWRNATLMARTVRSTQTWKDRFGAVTQARKDKGYSYLSEADIVGLEDSYRESLSRYGLPTGFYDSPDDFQKWIADDVSPSEVLERAEIASQVANRLDEGTRTAFKDYYGVGSGDLTAYFLDRTRATDLLTKQVAAAQLGAEATDAGVSVTGGLLTDLAGSGIGRQQFREAAQETASSGDDWRRLAQLGGQQITQESLLQANLGMDAATGKKLKGLASQERGRFGGSGGGTSALGRQSEGSY